ncbi:hypothetical protein LMIV_2662 [Listeria monocytogenes FSL J1-208]|nr:hypothetical protein LMIV_2662 [Listeria monocytogenes FSL J1-208]
MKKLKQLTNQLITSIILLITMLFYHTPNTCDS